MKYLIRVALAVVSVATIAPVADAATSGFPHSSLSQHQGPYDNTGHQAPYNFTGGDGG